MSRDNDNQTHDSGAADFELGVRFEDAPEDEKGTPGSADDAAPDKAPLLSALQDVSSRMAELSEAFDTKLKYDAHKNKIIDELHQELQEYRDDLIKKHLHSTVVDVIKIIDDIRKFKAHYESQETSPETTAQLLDFMEEVAGDLEDLFTWQGIAPFTCQTAHFDNTRQRVVKKIETHDPSMDKAIARSIRPGYEWDGKILRPELVAVYVYDHTEKGDML